MHLLRGCRSFNKQLSTILSRETSLLEHMPRLLPHQAGLGPSDISFTTTLEKEKRYWFLSYSHSNRGTWSNGSRGAQRLLIDIMNNPKFRRNVDDERESFYRLIIRRADTFINEASASGLLILPYHGGFFITVPAEAPQAVTNKLAASNIFAVPLEKGVRFAICAIPTYKVPGLAIRTKEALEG